MDLFASVLLSSSLLLFNFVFSDAAGSIITQSQTLRDIEGTILVSKDAGFALGFFSPGNSSNRYLGIWYNNIPGKTVVWVANRLKPIPDSSGELMVNSAGSLVLLSQNGTVSWSANSIQMASDPTVELLDSGNLVLREANDNYLWQSFDSPSDTWLPGMKIGWDLRIHLERRLTEWKSLDDPSPGETSWGVELHDYPELIMMKGYQRYFRSGPWNGFFFSGMPELQPNPILNFSFVSNKDEVHFMFDMTKNSVITRAVLSQSQYSIYLWMKDENKWVLYSILPKDKCDTYNLCGAYGNCILSESPICQCVEGFKPVSRETGAPEEWSRGCVRSTQLSCQDKDKIGFVRIAGLKKPATTDSWLNESMNLDECRVKCLNDCSCTAYANTDVRNGGSGCAIWFGDLIDIRQMAAKMPDAYVRDVYIRMPASEQGMGL